MSSNKQKRQILKARRAHRENKKSISREVERLFNKSWIEVDTSKIVSCSWLPDIPKFYVDYNFVCKDCGKWQVWTAKKQQWWYEEAGGVIESVATRCRPCRVKERERKVQARKVHFEGLAKKHTHNI